jgi:hypothetical protein
VDVRSGHRAGATALPAGGVLRQGFHGETFPAAVQRRVAKDLHRQFAVDGTPKPRLARLRRAARPSTLCDLEPDHRLLIPDVDSKP